MQSLENERGETQVVKEEKGKTIMWSSLVAPESRFWVM